MSLRPQGEVFDPDDDQLRIIGVVGDDGKIYSMPMETLLNAIRVTYVGNAPDTATTVIVRSGDDDTRLMLVDVDGDGQVKVNNLPADYPLPASQLSALASEATSQDIEALLASLDTKDFATDTELQSVASQLTTLNAKDFATDTKLNNILTELLQKTEPTDLQKVDRRVVGRVFERFSGSLPPNATTTVINYTVAAGQYAFMDRVGLDLTQPSNNSLTVVVTAHKTGTLPQRLLNGPNLNGVLAFEPKIMLGPTDRLQVTVANSNLLLAGSAVVSLFGELGTSV